MKIRDRNMQPNPEKNRKDRSFEKSTSNSHNLSNYECYKWHNIIENKE